MVDHLRRDSEKERASGSCLVQPAEADQGAQGLKVGPLPALSQNQCRSSLASPHQLHPAHRLWAWPDCSEWAHQLL